MSNVFLFTMDAFRADLVDAQTTPFLSKLKSNSLFFSQAIATGSGTSSSFPGILAGSLPLDFGYSKLRDKHVTIPEKLPDSVNTIGISSSTPTSHLFNYDRGFDTFIDAEGGSTLNKLRSAAKHHPIVNNSEAVISIGKSVFGMLNKISPGNAGPPYMQAEEVADNIIASLDGVSNNVFLWAHFMDTHTPYHPPDHYIKSNPHPSFTKKEVNKIKDEYRKNVPPIHGHGTGEELSEEEFSALKHFYQLEARYIDEKLEEVFSHLRSLFNDFTVIICADHGEEFGEHGHFGHRPKMYDELIHVPLLIHSHGKDQNESEIQDPTSLYNIPPTVVDIFDESPSGSWKGTSLLDNDFPGQNHVLSELSHSLDEGLGGSVQPEKAIISVRESRWKYIHNRQQTFDELYDLPEDPLEANNIIEKEPEEKTRLQKIAKKRVDELTEKTINMDPAEDVKDRLDQLGYMQK